MSASINVLQIFIAIWIMVSCIPEYSHGNEKLAFGFPDFTGICEPTTGNDAVDIM